MSHWLTIILAAVCGFNGLWQIRMTLIYLGVLQSAIVGSGSLVHTSLRSALTSLTCSAVFLFIPWPKLVTFIVGIFAVQELIDLFFVSRSIGNYRITKDNPKLRLHHFKAQCITIAIYVASTAVSAYFLGY